MRGDRYKLSLKGLRAQDLSLTTLSAIISHNIRVALALDSDVGAVRDQFVVPGVVAYSRTWVAVLVTTDVVLFLVASHLASLATLNWWSPGVSALSVEISAASAVALSLIVFWRVGLYRASIATSIRDEFYDTVAALVLASGFALILFSLFQALPTSRTAAVGTIALAIFLVGSARGLVYGVRHALDLAHPRRIVLVGTPTRVAAAETAMRAGPCMRVFPLAVPGLDEFRAANADAVASSPWFAQAVSLKSHILIFTEILAPSLLPHVVAAAKAAGMTVGFAPPRLQVHAYDLSIGKVGTQALIMAKPLRATTPHARLIKRLFDLVIASVALMIFGPLMLVVAMLIWLEDRGEIFYRQERVGRNGRVFVILKFRSMRVDAERDGPQFAKAGDRRVTRVGKFIRRTSVDEFPQLFNVLGGEMSIVGPRPERPVFAERFAREIPRYAERQLVPPGITGWSQVNGCRGGELSDIPRRVRGDLFYIENWSLFMDVAVCCKTAAEVLFHKAA